jgi:hypothetical protein
VDQNSHIVVMEYEAWFGHNAVTFQGTAALPLLQSADMQRLGGGYDSADPAVNSTSPGWNTWELMRPSAKSRIT